MVQYGDNVLTFEVKDSTDTIQQTLGIVLPSNQSYLICGSYKYSGSALAWSTF